MLQIIIKNILYTILNWAWVGLDPASGLYMTGLGQAQAHFSRPGPGPVLVFAGLGLGLGPVFRPRPRPGPPGLPSLVIIKKHICYCF